MPKLLIFAVSRQAILSQEDRAVSIISVLPGFTVQLQPGETVQADALSPVYWGISACWLVESEDQGKMFEHRFQIIKPNGDIFPLAQHTSLAEQTRLNLVIQGTGFPTGQPGVHLVTLDMREADQGKEWHRFGEYPMEILHTEIPYAVQEEAPVAPI